MKVIRTQIPEVLLLEPKTFDDERGVVWESHNRRSFAEATGLDVEFVQDNHSRSRRNVLRGLHFQLGRPQGKLVRVVRGEIFDVAVDLRRTSPTFKRWVSFTLSDRGPGMAWIPPGFGHGLLAVADADVIYKMTEYYDPKQERTVAWNDPELAIAWPIGKPILSRKDADAPRLAAVELFP